MVDVTLVLVACAIAGGLFLVLGILAYRYKPAKERSTQKEARKSTSSQASRKHRVSSSLCTQSDNSTTWNVALLLYYRYTGFH